MRKTFIFSFIHSITTYVFLFVHFNESKKVRAMLLSIQTYSGGLVLLVENYKLKGYVNYRQLISLKYGCVYLTTVKVKKTTDQCHY